MLKTKTRLFNISSLNAVNGSFKSQINVQLPDLSFHNEQVQNVYLSVAHCEVPNSFYIINYASNQIVVDGITYTIPVGNYNVNSFITVAQSVLPSGFTITYDSITNKFTFKYNSSFTIDGSSINSTINKIIGLDSSLLTSSFNGTNYIITLPHVVNFLPLQRINFRSNVFNFNNYNSTDGSCDVFLPLQNSAGQLSMINYVNQSNDEFLLQDKSLTAFQINVTDDYNNYINFNGVNWTMTLKIKIEYLDNSKTNTNFSEIIKNFPRDAVAFDSSKDAQNDLNY